MSSLLRPSRLKALVALPLSALFLQALSVSARAEVKVSGEGTTLKIEAADAPLEEVLAALGKSSGLQYNYPANLSRSVSGTYTGPLRQVLSRLLQGTNFVVEDSGSGTKVVIYELNPGNGGGVTMTSNSLPEPVANAMRQVPAWRPNQNNNVLPPINRRDQVRAARGRRPPIGR